MKLRDDVKPVYWRLFDGESDTAATELKEQLRKLHDDQAEEWRNQWRVLVFIDVGLPGAPAMTGLSPHAACFDVPLANILDQFEEIDSACKRVGDIGEGHLAIGFGQFGAEGEYMDMKTRTIYGERMIYQSIPEVLMAKNVIRRAGRFGWLWSWFVQRYDREWPMS